MPLPRRAETGAAFAGWPGNRACGRSWELPDLAALLVAFGSGGIDRPVDFERANDTPQAEPKGPLPAAGWIVQLRAEDGLWGRVRWTSTAAEKIGRRKYRFLARSFLLDPQTPRIVEPKGAGPAFTPTRTRPPLNAMHAPTPPATPALSRRRTVDGPSNPARTRSNPLEPAVQQRLNSADAMAEPRRYRSRNPAKGAQRPRIAP